MADGETSFGALLRSCRMAVGLTQEDLAGRSGLSVRAISNLERGLVARPRRSSVIRLAHGLRLPNRELQRLLEARVSATAIAVPSPPRPRTRTPGAVARPRQLPRPAPYLVGREKELAALDEVLARVGSAVTSEIVAITGPAGVGKSALALQWAQKVADQFPHGQLYIDLHGFSVGPPVSSAEALAQFLRALGVEASRIPSEAAEAACLFRSVLAKRRVLLVLDNAASADQVRPLLPSGSACLVVVTSRDRLTGLVGLDGAHSLALDVLDPAAATEMLARAIGPARAAAEPQALAELSARCGYLPLALAVAAATVAHHPRLTLAEHAARFRPLQSGDSGNDLRTALDVSYHRLPPDARRLFRRLGLVGSAEVTVAAAAALIDESVVRTMALLDELCAIHLIECVGVDRYRLPDLLSQYAIERAHVDDSPRARRRARQRLVEVVPAGSTATLVDRWSPRLA
jgi:transcriptional regulator with XRE-family HTH domain